MDYQYSLSATFSHLERYRGFFPSFADEQIDLSTKRSTAGESKNGRVDNRWAETGESVGDLQHKTKRNGDAFSEEIGCSSSSGSLLSGSNGSSSGTSTGGQDGARRRVRKAKTPRRSARKNDPRFRGITFSVETKPCQEKCQKSQLLIRSFYSIKKKLLVDCTARSKRRRSSVSSSSSSSEPDTRASETTPYRRVAIHDKSRALGGKQCASCLTRHTPLWRDAGDGTPLCNACGIRYKKYGMRCVSCWHIPKKDDTMSNNGCSRCGRITLLKDLS